MDIQNKLMNVRGKGDGGVGKKNVKKKSVLKGKILIKHKIKGDSDCHPFGIHEMIRLIATLFQS